MTTKKRLPRTAEISGYIYICRKKLIFIIRQKREKVSYFTHYIHRNGLFLFRADSRAWCLDFGWLDIESIQYCSILCYLFHFCRNLEPKTRFFLVKCQNFLCIIHIYGFNLHKISALYINLYRLPNLCDSTAWIFLVYGLKYTNKKQINVKRR